MVICVAPLSSIPMIKLEINIVQFLASDKQALQAVFLFSYNDVWENHEDCISTD